MMKLLGFPHLMGMAAVLLAAAPLRAGSVDATSGPFVAPANVPVPFRRDRLPLDADTMTFLSEQLSQLANAQGGASSEKRRTVAQLLALALAVQPANQEARRILDKFSDNKQKAWGEQSQLAAASAEVWKIHGWLETPAAGVAGHALAACLGDVMAHVDPRHPRADDLRKAGEQGAWSGWVQPLAAFHKPEEVAVVKIDPPDKRMVPLPMPTPKPDGPILLATAVVNTPLWTYDSATKSTVLRSVPIRMQAKLKDGHAKTDPLSCFVESTESTSHSNTYVAKFSATNLIKALEHERGKVPAGVAVGLVCGVNADYLIERNRNAISGAAAVLTNAAIAGCEPSATIIGEIEADGSFKLPPRFWEKLRALSDGPGGRLVLPMEADSYLLSVLAIEDPEFFFKYEVLLASNLKELIARSAKTPEPELAQVSAKYLEIRSKLGSQPAAAYAANRFVRQRLDDIAKGSSFHASARMLAIQGGGNRPSLLPRNLLACELRKAIKPMEWIPRYPVNGTYDSVSKTTKYPPLPNIKNHNDSYEACNKELNRLGRYVEMRDRDILVQCRDLINTIRILSRALRGRPDPYTYQVPYRDEFNALARAYQVTLDKLNHTAIDESWR
jgi:hypothetical protein